MDTIKMHVIGHWYGPRTPGGTDELIKGSKGAPIEVTRPAKVVINGALVDHPEYAHLVRVPPPPPINPSVTKKPEDAIPPTGRELRVKGDDKKSGRAADR